MAEVKLPELGENVEEGEVVDVRVSAGDEVREGQPLLEVEAEKSTVEVPSPLAGRIAEMLVKKGDRVRTGQRLCRIEGGDGKQAAKEQPAKKQPAEEQPAKEKKDDAIPAEQPQGKESPKESPKAATAGPPAGEAAQPVAPVARQEAAERQKAPAATADAPGQPKHAEEKLVPAGPATRRLARELGVELARVSGSAPGGRVTQDDVKAYVRRLASGTVTPTAGIKTPTLPDFEQWGPVERKPLDAVRRKTAEHVALAWSQIPHVTHHDLADITELDSFGRQQDKDDKGPKLTVTAFALKAAAIVLRQFPPFNASLDSAAQQLVLKQYCHIGIAVDTERGLLVPVIRDVDKKSVHDLAGEMAGLAEQTRQKKLTSEQMRGGCFTISNLGGIGGIAFTPIINYPEVAILGLSRARLQAVARDGQFVPRLLLPLSLSYDHRVIDGADAARFTRRLAELLENPMEMLLFA